MTQSPKEHVIIIDAHVHIGTTVLICLSYFLNAAYDNCRAEIRRLQKNDQFLGVLLMTETSKDHWFERLGFYADNKETITDNDTSRVERFHRTAEM